MPKMAPDPPGRLQLRALRGTAGYEDQAEDLYYLDEPAGSFEQDLVYALDAGVRHTVNQALAQAIQPIKHQLLGFVEQQGWVAPSGIRPIGEPPLPANTQASKQSTNPHSADFESFIRNMAREHDYNSGSHKKAEMTRSKFWSLLSPFKFPDELDPSFSFQFFYFQDCVCRFHV
ncbi:hypothetical protein NDU88_005797 [Pleurodeles waltl]|uniref:Uncharacterized protein n=1 Tax=Pleurodeles waltl TaxID=8319 RepID=A0AAV7SMZ1_PLEWA|nr:hypothetical protein NDU88_005797 [Pleurodeles waltl]